MTRARVLVAVLAVVMTALLAGCQAPTATLIAAGDIADCNNQGDEATAALLDEMEGTIVALGDFAYEDGTAENFAECYEPNWGRHKERTIPVIGNNEYDPGGPQPYLDYFGEAAAPGGTLWHSTQVGSWHLIVLDSNCAQAGCDAASEQVAWLIDDLAASNARCTMAAMHHPRWSSGTENRNLGPIWVALYEAGVDVVLSAHEHAYERFAPLTPDGQVDDDRGIRSFVVGTGGGGLTEYDGQAAHSEAMDHETWGVLRMSLRPDSYDWEFVPVAGSTFTDRGSSVCH